LSLLALEIGLLDSLVKGFAGLGVVFFRPKGHGIAGGAVAKQDVPLGG